jgi:hypothetical protein
MNPIHSFRERLRQINLEVLQAPFPDLSHEMALSAKALQREFGDIATAPADSHSIEFAVLAYLNTRQLNTFRDIKYICFGVSSPYGAESTRLIEHEVLFTDLLKTVEHLQTEPRKFRRCYQGLLKCYFNYRGYTTELVIGGKNWLILRDFLAQHCKALSKQKPVMDWAQALYQHKNLLEDKPCKPYAKALLVGDLTVVDELKNRLGVDDDTWVMDELVLAHVQASTALKDAEFVQQISPLIQLLEKHTLLITKGLALLLRRYEACIDRPEHHGLRDTALREWKSPWLEANKPMWHAQIGETATNMVKLWLTKQHIKDFFELLQADRQADTQRMEFWLQYAEAIEDFWLALGSFSFYNQQADYKRIRKQMEGHCMRLEGSNQNYDNAFLMKIGNFVFIEFGKQNNACHVFSSNNLPFATGQASVSGTQSGLKNTRHPGWQNKLSHRENWQQDFAYILRQYANASPINNHGNKTQYSSTQILPTLSVSKNRKSANSLSPSNSELKLIDIDWLREFCAIHNLHFVDHRHHGGAVWVRTSDNEPTISDALKNAGFKYHKYKFAWWRE